MKIKSHTRTTVTFDAQELAEFVERARLACSVARLACSVALGDLLALGMPSINTSTGKLLANALHNIKALQDDLDLREGTDVKN